MRQTVLKEYYCGGHTELTLSNKYGIFSASCDAVDEDADIATKWDGFRFCEYKIMIQTLKTKARFLQERAKGMRHLINMMDSDGKADESNDYLDVILKMERLAKIADCDAKNVREQARKMEEAYPAYTEYVLSERKRYNTLNENFNKELQTRLDTIEENSARDMEI